MKTANTIKTKDTHIEVFKNGNLVVKLDKDMEKFAEDNNIFLVANVPYYKDTENNNTLLRHKLDFTDTSIGFKNNDHNDYRKENLISKTGIREIKNTIKEINNETGKYLEIYKKDKLIVILDIDKKEFAETHNIFKVADIIHYTDENGDRKNIKYAFGFDSSHRMKFKNKNHHDYRISNISESNITDNKDYSKMYIRKRAKNVIVDYDACIKKIVTEINTYYKTKLNVEDNVKEAGLHTLSKELFELVEEDKKRFRVIKRFIKAYILNENNVKNIFTKISSYKSLKFDDKSIIFEAKNALSKIEE